MNIPVLAYPLQLTPRGAKTVEQDSFQDIYGCVTAICDCRQGARVDLPAFGIPSPMFQQAPLDPVRVEQSIMTWEPRASIAVTTHPDALDASTWRIHVAVGNTQ